MNLAMVRGAHAPLHVLLATLLALSACLGDPREHLDRAQELAFQRRPAEALRHYEEVLSLLAKKDPRKVRSLLVPALKGAGDLCYLELRQSPKAVDHYRALANHFPDALETLDARSNLSEIFRSLGDRRSAVAELTAIVQSFPEGPEADRFQYLATKDYFELGDYDQVLVEARALQNRWPQSSFAVESEMLVAAALSLQGQRERAIDAYEQVLRRWPDHALAAHARFEQAKVLAELGREERAVDILVEALRTHPDPRGVQAEIARLRKRVAIRRVPERVDHSDVWPEFYGLVPPEPKAN